MSFCEDSISKAEGLISSVGLLKGLSLKLNCLLFLAAQVPITVLVTESMWQKEMVLTVDKEVVVVT